ncbi:fibronectin type III domain-containing protein [uncultured Draconibacterium sp.]|uniref:fibronectin type III domain-containing protein n=1 Tax=uncultured Draconibacterium sp. TaxID=1573823 RepID=UPI002AA62811|nr:hypothetical protein [uncultured Draconibacterium sp.]
MSKSKTIYTLLFAALIGFAVNSCTETEYVYVIEEPETNPPTRQSLGNFEIESAVVSDKDAMVSWSAPKVPDSIKLTYEVGLNDSVVFYNLTSRNVLIQNLSPFSSYKVSVKAYDSDRNYSVADTLIKTRGSNNLQPILKFNLDYKTFQFMKIKRTADNGFMILGMGQHTFYGYSSRNFMLKINQNFEIEWLKEFDWEEKNNYETVLDFVECPDGSYVIAQYLSVVKVDAYGNKLWQIRFAESYEEMLGSQMAYNQLTGDTYFCGLFGSGHGFTIININSEGQKVWEKSFPYSKNVYCSGVEFIDNQLFFAGNIGEEERLFIAGFSSEGTKLYDKELPNEYAYADVILNSEVTSDGNILLYGAIAGEMGEYGYYNTQMQIIKLNINGDILWRIYPDYPDGKIFSSVWLSTIENNDTRIFQTSHDRGSELYRINSDGNILMTGFNMRGYPTGLYGFIDEPDIYTYFTREGLIITIDMNGNYDESN